MLLYPCVFLLIKLDLKSIYILYLDFFNTNRVFVLHRSLPLSTMIYSRLELSKILWAVFNLFACVRFRTAPTAPRESTRIFRNPRRARTAARASSRTWTASSPAHRAAQATTPRRTRRSAKTHCTKPE
jgi:hypothetical protein